MGNVRGALPGPRAKTLAKALPCAVWLVEATTDWELVMRASKNTLAGALLLCAALTAQADLARVGPTNTPSPPGHGFPLWYQDLNGLVLDFCLPNASDPGALQQTACLLGPPNPPYVFPTNWPDEAFYYRAVSQPLSMANPTVAASATKRATLVLALEGAFGSGTPVAGQQMVFTRIRVTAGVPVDGTYTVTHPFGVEVFDNVVAGVGNRDIVFTEDVGVIPGVFSEALSSRFGPFLQAVDASGNPKRVTLNGATFLSDGVAPETLTGSPFGTNFFQICGPADAFGPGVSCVTQPLFSLTGRLRDLVANPVASPLAINRATYSRDAVNGVRVDVVANASAGIGAAAPKLTAAAGPMAPVLMSGPTITGDYYAQGLTLPKGAHPGMITVINSGDVPPSTAARNAADEVVIAAASYDQDTDTLTVVATTSDKGDLLTVFPPPLSLGGHPNCPAAPTPPTPGCATVTVPAIVDDPASARFVVTGLTVPPRAVVVTSSAGGQGRLDVAMGSSVSVFPPGVPLALDDSASTKADSGPIVIPVLDNDHSNPAAPANPATLTLLAPGLTPNLGALTVDPLLGKLSFTPNGATGEATVRYTVANAVGTSNPGTLTISVSPPVGGPIPVANADTATVTTNGSVIINVLANDSGNGGTLDPSTVTITTAPAVGTATVNTTNGAITYTASASTGTVNFAYKVKDVGGSSFSAPANVAVSVVSPEAISVTTNRCQRASASWDLRGTSTIANGNTITFYTTALVPASPTPAQILGSATVTAGAWTFKLKGSTACTTPISLKSSFGTKLENVGINIQ